MTEPTETLDGEVLADFAGELRRFRLTVPYLARLEADCKVGAFLIAGELAHVVEVVGAWKGVPSMVGRIALLRGSRATSDYVKKTLLFGLIGGGMTPEQAGRLVRDQVDERSLFGLLEAAELAFSVVSGAIFGPKDDPVGEFDGAAGESQTPPK